MEHEKTLVFLAYMVILGYTVPCRVPYILALPKSLVSIGFNCIIESVCRSTYFPFQETLFFIVYLAFLGYTGGLGSPYILGMPNTL